MMSSERVAKWYDMTGRVVVLTGGTGRLARHYSIVLSEVGANVVLVDLDQATCDEVAEELRKDHGTDPMGLQMDISNKAEVAAGMNRIWDKYGRIDVLINNAAANQLTVFDGKVIGFEDFPLEYWQDNLNVNLTGALLCCQEAGKRMVEQGGGVILNIGSVYGVVACDQRIYGDTGINSSVAYATTKSGIMNFTRYLASYWQGKNIRVNSLSPGGVFNGQAEPFLSNYTTKTMMKRMAELDDLASALLYLTSDASAWVTGTNLMVDGGWTAW
jgi:NAD(P)-dependent dehydrogenase (short-subunit alcohol dehydrogenase family)